MVVLREEPISRSEIRRIIRSYQRSGVRKGWYQNVRFGTCLATRRTLLDHLIELVRPRISKEDVVIQNLPELEGKKVIDIGCNAGAYSVAASCRGAKYVFGVDKSALRVEQAERVAEIFRRMGRLVGQVDFRVVDDVMTELHLIDDMDVLMACCVLYHLGPLEPFKSRIQSSNVRTLVLQGNLSRVSDDTPPNKNSPTNGRRKNGGVADSPGLRQFCESMGFTTTKVVEHDFPVVIAQR